MVLVASHTFPLQTPVFLNYLSTKLVPYANKWFFFYIVYVSMGKVLLRKIYCSKAENRLVNVYIQSRYFYIKKTKQISEVKWQRCI